MSEYKEFWIQASNMIAHDDKPPIAKQLFHVIEYAAFEKLKKQNEIMREALEFNISKHNKWIDQGHWCDSKRVLQSIVDSSIKSLKDVEGVG